MSWQMLVLVLGLITAVDAANGTLVLDTRGGPVTLAIPPSASIRGDGDRALAFRDLAPGDAVSYDAASATLRVARHFWAIPDER